VISYFATFLNSGTTVCTEVELYDAMTLVLLIHYRKSRCCREPNVSLTAKYLVPDDQQQNLHYIERLVERNFPRANTAKRNFALRVFSTRRENYFCLKLKSNFEVVN
jgi:hypothetical protein